MHTVTVKDRIGHMQAELAAPPFAPEHEVRARQLGTNPMPWDLLIVGTSVSLAVIASGALYFRRTERIFADVA